MSKGYFVYGGDKYELSNGEAREGDLLLFTVDGLDVTAGRFYEVINSNLHYVEFLDDVGDEHSWDADGSFLVLRKVVSESPTTDSDLIANLARRVHELEERLDSAEKDVQSFAESATEADYKAGQALTSVKTEVFSNNTLDELRLKVKVIDDYQDILIDKMNGMHDTTEMLTDDIVLLDERTQPLVEDNTDGLAKELAEEVIKRIREAIE